MELTKAKKFKFRPTAEMRNLFVKMSCWATREDLVDCPGSPQGALYDLVSLLMIFPPRCFLVTTRFLFAFIVLALFEIIFGGISK